MSTEAPRQSSFSAENLKPEYRAFISYRHMDNEEEGRQWASWLHQTLETYDVPSELVGEVNELGQPIPERVYPVFRDEEDLPADADLATAICSAVERSQCLVVLCSPRSAQSKYVAEEIAYFKQLGRENRILAVLIEGEPNASWDEGKQAAGIGPDRECFPLPLMHPVSPEGELDTTVHAEPIAADFRIHPEGAQGWTNPAAYRESLANEGKLGAKEIDAAVKKYEEQLQLGLHKILAGVLAVPLRTLTQKDKAYQLEKARKRARQLRAWLAATGVLALAAIGAAVFATTQKRVAEEQRQVAETQKQLAEEQRQVAEKRGEETRRTLYASEMNTAARALEESSGPIQVKELLGHWHPQDDQTDLRGWEWYYLRSKLEQAEWVLEHPKRVRTGDWSPDGRTVYTGDRAGTVRAWDSETGRLLQVIKVHSPFISALRANPVDGRVATLTTTGFLKVLDPQSGRLSLERKLSGTELKGALTLYWTELSWSPDGTRLVVSDGPQTLLVLDGTSGQILLKLEETVKIGAADWHRDGKRILVGAGKELVIWDTVSGETRRISIDQNNSISVFDTVIDARWLPDGRVVAGWGNNLVLVDPATEKVKQFDVEGIHSTFAVQSTTGLLAYGGGQMGVNVIDPENGTVRAVFQGHTTLCRDVRWSPDGQRLLSASEDSARIWQVARPDPDTVSSTGAVDLDWRPGRTELAMGTEGRVNVIAAPDYRQVATYNAGGGQHVAAWSPAGDHIAVASATHLALWERAGREPLWKVALRDKPRWPQTSKLAWEPGGERISYSSQDIQLSLYSARDGSHLRRLETAREINTWHPDGGQLAFQSSDLQVTVADADSGETIDVLENYGGNRDINLAALDWHPEGKFLATTRQVDFVIELWEMPGGKKIRQFRGGSSMIDSLAWSPDGRLLAIGNADKTLRLYDHQLGRIVLTLKEAGQTRSLAWDDSSSRLAYRVKVAGVPSVAKVLDAGQGYLAENSPKALPWIDQHIAAAPDHVGHRYRRANLLEALDRPDEARAEWQRLAKLRPDDPDFAARSRGASWQPETLTPRVASSGEKVALEPSPEQQSAAKQRLDVFTARDTNGDDRVSLKEFLGPQADHFRKKLDQDGDGILSDNEFTHPTQKKMDADGDGRTTFKEFMKHHARDFGSALDKNGDGFWTKDEIQ